MEQIYIVMAKLRKAGEWHSLCAFKKWQDAQDYVFENQKNDEQIHACCWCYKIETCGLQL